MFVYFKNISDRGNRLSFKTFKEIRKYYFRMAFKLIINPPSKTFINTLKKSKK